MKEYQLILRSICMHNDLMTDEYLYGMNWPKTNLQPKTNHKQNQDCWCSFTVHQLVMCFFET